MNDAVIRLLLILIAAATVLSGVTQLVAPEFVLDKIAGETSSGAQHLFRTVGMFMAITGALFLQTLLNHSTDRAIPLWIGVQKLAAAVLVAWGVHAGLFGPIALCVAGFDLISGILAWIFMARIGK